MAKQLSKAGIVDGRLAQAYHVTQSIDAFTGVDAYDITLSGSLVVTGSTNISGTLGIPGFPDVSASLAAADDGFPFTGSAIITGSLIVTGSTNIDGLVTATSFSGDGSNITGVTGEWDGTHDGNAEITGSTILLASEASDLSFEINESASFEFLTGGPNSGSFIVQTSPDTGKGELQTFFGQGTAVIASQNIPNQIFGVKYTSGSGASQGELTMTVGKRDLTNLGSSNLNNFFVAYEPSGILTNAEGELEFHLGDHFKVGNGIVLEYRGGATGTTQTSSFAGYFSSSAFPNQQQYTKPFAISTLSQVNDSNPAFVINKSIDHLTASAFSVDYGGNVTATGNISASGDLEATNITSNGAVTASVYANKFGSFTLGTPDDFIFIEPGGDSTIDFRSGETNFKYNDLFFKDAQDGVTVILQGSNGADNVIMEFGDPEFESTGRKLTLNIDNASAHFSGLDVTGSKHGLFQAGKPIITHTSSPISASLANAGKYHIVGGTLTASIVLDSNAPVGAEYEFFQSSSAGQFLFESASGTTVISKNGSMRLAQQGSSAVLKKVSSTTFHLMGDLT